MKKFGIVNLFFLVVCGSLFAQDLSSDEAVYKVGDTGPAGGIIFYDKGFFSDGWRYLEAASNDIIAFWGAPGRNVGNTDTAIGSGKRNTEIIVVQLNQWGVSNSAAQVCVEMDINGYKDWFLPSKDELDLMYRNLKLNGLGDFGASTTGAMPMMYWSSSQVNDGLAWSHDFNNGIQANLIKMLTVSIRAVRAF